MSYTSPTITATTDNFAALQAQGYKGHVESLIAANSFSADQKKYLRSLAGGPNTNYRVNERFSELFGEWNQGRPVASADIQAAVLDLTTAVKAYLAILEEIATLLYANPGTLNNGISANGLHVKKFRTWP